MILKKKFLMLGLFFIVLTQAQSKSYLQYPEVISNYTSDISVRDDASMMVTETICYTNYGVQGLHGIYRDFPTHYKDRWGNNVVVGFEIKQILRDGNPVPYHLVSRANGKRIYIGDKHSIVPPGKYVYTIRYTTKRQLGFFEDHDELYWNVTGNGWKFPIEHVVAEVSLPGVPGDKIGVDAYTGFQGDRGQSYQAHVNENDVIVFEAMHILRAREGLTIVVAWPKGFVTPPTFSEKVVDFFKDNAGVLILFVGLLMLLVLYGISYIRFRRNQQKWKGTIIPRFYPPDGCTPSAVRYLERMKFDAICFASEIVHMAVHGRLIIDYQDKGLFAGGKTYTLKARAKGMADIDTDKKEYQPLYDQLFSILLGKKNPLTLSETNRLIIKNAMNYIRSFLSSSYDTYFIHNYDVIIAGIVISIASFFIAVALDPGTSDSALTWLFLAVYVLANIVTAISLRGYTQEGMRLAEEIEGFKLFLAITESDRMKMVGTPPTKTPELYETYLPYAIALGVEEQWSVQFASIFAKLETEGHPYVPFWYVGHGRFYPPHVNFSNMGSTINSAISASSTPPGRSSGFGGRGSSGGGGGGGGGGSW